MTRLQFIGAALIACALCAGGGTWYGYAWGTEAEHNRTLANGLDAYIDEAKRTARISDAIAAIGAYLRTALADSREHERTTTTAIPRIIREHPDFAAVRRPPELQRLRRADLERIAAAAATDRVRRRSP